jgi:hypothetical protein
MQLALLTSSLQICHRTVEFWTQLDVKRGRHSDFGREKDASPGMTGFVRPELENETRIFPHSDEGSDQSN